MGQLLALPQGCEVESGVIWVSDALLVSNILRGLFKYEVVPKLIFRGGMLDGGWENPTAASPELHIPALQQLGPKAA